MGFFDSIYTEDDADITINGETIKGGYYQSKDFMYDENGTYWQGDDYIITADGFIAFTDEDKKDVKITGLISIYNDYDYFLLVEQNKILKVYENVFFDDLPEEAKKDYNVRFGEEYSLKIDATRLECSLNKRRLKKKRTRIEKKVKNDKLSRCKIAKTFNRKKRNKAPLHREFFICIEKYNPFFIIDEAHSYIDEGFPKLAQAIKSI